jgi:hypothetical protein
VDFYIGTNSPGWLKTFPHRLFVSHVRLSPYKTLPVAKVPWALDSGAFTQLKDYGRFIWTPQEYAAAATRYQEEIGRMEWASIQDWMCEEHILQKTGLSVGVHQLRTVESYHRLRELAPTVRWTPVLQGFTIDDYLRCWELYEASGVCLACLPLVGLGSVCRRQDTKSTAAIVGRLAGEGLKLHGFGVKTTGLSKYGHLLTSADSMAWSLDARWEPGKWQEELGCTHRSCSTCPLYALKWRDLMLDKIQLKCKGQWVLAL